VDLRAVFIIGCMLLN